MCVKLYHPFWDFPVDGSALPYLTSCIIYEVVFMSNELTLQLINMYSLKC